MGHDDQKTEIYTDGDWKDPVATKAELPDGASEGDFCYVKEESAIYAFKSGAWILEITKKP